MAREDARRDTSALAVLSLAIWIVIIPLAVSMLLLPVFLWLRLSAEWLGLALLLAYVGFLFIPISTEEKLREMRTNHYLIENLQYQSEHQNSKTEEV